MVLLAVDPSVRSLGAALFVDGRLKRAGTVKRDTRGLDPVERVRAMVDGLGEWLRLDRPESVVCEWPRIYPYGSEGATARPNDLFFLAGICGGLACAFPAAVLGSVEPAEWGGQMDKAKKRARVLLRLDHPERLLAQSLGQDAIDAVGIGLHCLGRFERRRVFAGATE